MINKQNKKLYNNQYLDVFVKSYMKIHDKKHNNTKWDLFIRTKLWSDIHEKLSENTRELFKHKWEQLNEGRRLNENK